MMPRVRGSVKLLSALLIACLLFPIIPASAKPGSYGNLANEDGVTLSVLAEGQATVNFYQGDPGDGWSEIGLHRYQMTPGMAAAHSPTYAEPGDQNSTNASIAFAEYGTVSVVDSQGEEVDYTAPAEILDAAEMSNSSFDCAWVLSASHTVTKSMGGGAFTDAPNMLLPASVPCDESVETLALMRIESDFPPGIMTAFIGEIEFESGFEASNFAEDGFLGIAVERGDLEIAPNDSIDHFNEGSAFGLVEGSAYAIKADKDTGASGLIFGFIREPALTSRGPLQAILPGTHTQRGQFERRLR